MLYIGVAYDTWLLERANNNLMYDAQKSFFVNCYWHSSIYLCKCTHHNTLIVRSLMTKPKVNPETSVHLDKRKVKDHLRKQVFYLSLSLKIQTHFFFKFFHHFIFEIIYTLSIYFWQTNMKYSHIHVSLYNVAKLTKLRLQLQKYGSKWGSVLE